MIHNRFSKGLAKSAFLLVLRQASAQMPVGAVQKQLVNVVGIHQLYLQDQQDRGVGGTASPNVETNDAQRLARARMLLTSGSLTTAEDFHDAAFIFQHSLVPEDYLIAHVLAMEAVSKGDIRSKNIAASTLDRYLQAIGQPQVFGTQYSGTVTAQGRTATQQPYKDSLIPDSVRTDFCVVDRQKQQLNVKALIDNSPSFNSLPAGCRH